MGTTVTTKLQSNHTASGRPILAMQAATASGSKAAGGTAVSLQRVLLILLSVWFVAFVGRYQYGWAGEPLCISGIYPHLAVYNQPADPRERASHGEVGIGAIVPWAGKLWFITYPPHKTKGSNDKLYELDEQFNLTIRPESVGGTHAGRLIHRESQQLILGPYFIDREGHVRAADLEQLTGRLTAVARHLKDPARKVYFYDMEGKLYEVDVHTLAVRKLFEKPVPGWHGKGAYTGQGKLILANNGEHGPADAYRHLLVGGPAVGDEAGVLAEWDGQQWRIVERKQFCDVTGPGSIWGNPPDAPVWAIGWDRRSVILKVLEQGVWYTFRLPKGSYCYDARHGWFTEWPRIRELMPGYFTICMHGTFFELPSTFTARQPKGIRPLCTFLRVIPDYCFWNGRIVLGGDDASMMGNPMCGQAQSNLWFGSLKEMRRWGPVIGWGGPCVDDELPAGKPSDPFLIAGYRWRCLHIARRDRVLTATVPRCSDKFTVDDLPQELLGTIAVAVNRGSYKEPAPGYSFRVDKKVRVYLAVDARAKWQPQLPWKPTPIVLRWNGFSDHVFEAEFEPGVVDIPGHSEPHSPGAYPLPNLVFVKPLNSSLEMLHLCDLPRELGPRLTTVANPEVASDQPVEVAVEIYRGDTGQWETYKSIKLPPVGYRFEILPPELRAEWLRVRVNRRCRLTAFLHCYTPRAEVVEEQKVFAAVCSADNPRKYVGGIIRPAAHNRSLQWLRQVVSGDTETPQPSDYVEVDLYDRTKFIFQKPAEDRSREVAQVAALKTHFVVDEASVLVIDHRGRRWRLPKAGDYFECPFPTGWPRDVREVVTERFLANICGTFYEIPRAETAALPDYQRIKPVCSHKKLIADFCSWRGLLVLSGARVGTSADGHFFGDKQGYGLWFGCVDDLWKLGKPVGVGGPWKNSSVQAGVPSDPYLMTGYDKKRLLLSHNAEEPVEFSIEVDFDLRGFHLLDKVTVPPGRQVVYAFPAGFQAHWVRVVVDKDCTATAWFIYE